MSHKLVIELKNIKWDDCFEIADYLRKYDELLGYKITQ